ncbi:UDP-N-acetylmuramoyl-tripeptide--D-alanyl-D-alanine ligase [Streptacidiphilus sp. P02-A3a]|uniref:UDP-N-acetylmuramoyl-tripeptide--D-alanyl-D- alanine ligase n=1 Tax=Streptacidiphilus sp. P02-A3a TaxID=2704468 RepID=UPI0015F9C045|nr:UDP-N-acetylmuramoyl-tripeptide--D-alanyl-D-alanine ligase [Streptacidiphilus sp. P02-A3a]QMU73423.1 UDP-N-acetylmuramoyl-tripeptide--D-alanyl-D-alanine ligase [Streptacidiphilus sp. P02-A3a]
MLPLSPREIAAVVGGSPHQLPDPDALVTGPVVIDSRAVTSGSVFVAIAGERVDGHDYAAAAVADGAALVLAERPVPAPAVLVPDVRRALDALAASTARRLPAATRIGLTGSSGKTSTKDLLGQVLAQDGPTTATADNQNNELGVPLTVLAATPETRYLVLEMGARGLGDLSRLTRLVPLDVAVVLNVGTAHLGEFGTPEVIAQAKGELVEALGPDGIAVLNADDHRVAAMAERTQGSVTLFGLSARARIRAEDVSLDALGRPRFTLITPTGKAPVALRLLGAHQVSNALAVAAVAHRLGLPTDLVADALGRADTVTGGRMQLFDRADGVTVIDDAYNANPESMRAGLQALAAMGGGRRTVAVLGAMAELGDTAPEAHRAVGRLAGELGLGLVVGVGGEEAELITTAAAEHGCAVHRLPDPATAAAELDGGLLRPGDVVLVKSSRASGLRAVARALATGHS